ADSGHACDRAVSCGTTSPRREDRLLSSVRSFGVRLRRSPPLPSPPRLLPREYGYSASLLTRMVATQRLQIRFRPRLRKAGRSRLTHPTRDLDVSRPAANGLRLAA